MDAAAERQESFIRFSDLPAEIQSYIWTLALEGSAVICIKWRDAPLTSIIPVISIPPLTQSDQPGLIPYALPTGIPSTLTDFPPPLGVPITWKVPWFDFENQVVVATNKSTLSLGRLWKNLFGGSEKPNRDRQSYGPVAIYSACRKSREEFLRLAIIDSKTPLQPDRVARNDAQNYFYPFNKGVMFGSVFKDQRNQRRSLVFIFAPNTHAENQSCRIEQDFVPGKQSYVGAALADIERCIFGHRLSLTVVRDGLNKASINDLSRLMWLRPSLGSRARRTEANHPFYLPPGTIIWIYAITLHSLISSRKGDHPCFTECCTRLAMSLNISSSDWYFELVSTGKCSHCHRPLLRDLRQYFPELLDEEGCIDMWILLDRKRFESPEICHDFRSYEIEW